MRILLLAGLALLAVIGLGGCFGSSGQARASTTSSSIQEAIKQAGGIAPGIDAVVTGLSALQSGKVDLKTAYADLQSAAQSCGKLITALATDVKAARQSGETYAADWEKKIGTVENADIAATSRARLDQLKAGVERLAIAEKDYLSVTDAFTKQLKDLKTALDLDLSPGGVASLRSAIGTASAAAPAVKQQTATVIDRLRGLEEFLGGPAPAQ